MRNDSDDMPRRTPRGPAPAPDARDLPHPLTFFVTGRERAQILRALRRLDGDRAFALKRALGLA
ncbi:MAG TPA: hypothetical protein VFF69_06550 [Phycisphaerales bacterium]|nr:hypothetical protein [Phycisphaerales bacterium]